MLTFSRRRRFSMTGTNTTIIENEVRNLGVLRLVPDSSIAPEKELGMRTHPEALLDVSRYIRGLQSTSLEEKEPEYRAIMTYLSRFKKIDASTKLLEVGTGSGWFPILCKRNSISCKGLEISPQLVNYARKFGRAHGIEPDIELGNIEDTDLGEEQYDVVVATSVFEHVEQWERGIDAIYRALKPGGVMYFSSTSKFSFRSGEYRFPLYGWLPRKCRAALRVWRQGPDIMKLGFDFNQFTYPQLRQHFRKVGFSRVLDRIEMLDTGYLSNPRLWKKILLVLLKRSGLLKHVVLLFSQMTVFICTKS